MLTKLKPLVVDLDGTLIRSDLLIETAFAELGRRPQAAFGVLAALFRGKAALKHRLADPAAFDPAALPYDEAVMGLIREARDSGRTVHLASASNAGLVEAVADHLGVFDGWFASDEGLNLSGEAKAAQLVAAFGPKGFDYVGNDRADLAVWRYADQAIVIRPSGAARRGLQGREPPAVRLEAPRADWRTWLRMLRVHQYAKNALVLVPVLTSHQWMSAPLAFWAAVAFCLCASSIYLLNDLVDLAADRAHPTKRRRPLAAGEIPPLEALVLAPILALAGLGLAWMVSPAVLGVTLVYLALTTAYSFLLKRKLMLDVVTLALLYSIRVIGGAVAIGVALSPWLIGFSLFVFTSLALMKRHIELSTRREAGLSDPSNRNYRIEDLPVVMSIAAASSLNAVTVLAFYVTSDMAQAYSRPHVLWALCPLMLYWLGRALVLAHRRLIDDDPLVWAVTDRVSRYTVVAMLVVVALAL